MRLKELKIENFRGIRSLHLPLGPLTVLIGENNAGKSTVLEAIRLVLARGLGARRGVQFTEYDFHLKDANATPQSADPISIILHFAEEAEDEWPEAISQQLHEVIQIDANGLSHIWLHVLGSYQADAASFETKWAFQNEAGVELNLRNSAPLNLISRLIPVFFLSALRDASQEFGQRGQFWSGFLKSIQLPEEQRERIERMLREVNTSLIDANAALAEVTRKIAEAKTLVPLDPAAPVALEAIPTRVFEMVGKVQVHLKSSRGAKLPLQRHGEGTQSVAVLMLFQAFAAANLAEAFTPESTPILALEEPEAHLHPSAIRSLGSVLQTMTGQILVSSHSGDLVSRVPVTALRRIYKKNGDTLFGHIEESLLNPRERQAIDYSIRLAKGHYLFSRSWLLVEGESDYHLMPLLFELDGHAQDQTSFSILEVSQVFGKGEPLIKFAKALGVQWFLMVDGDTEGQGIIRRANNHLDAGEVIADRARALAHPDIEHEFWRNGYDVFIRGMVPAPRQAEITMEAAGDGNRETKLLIAAAINLTGGKPAFAQALASEVKRRGVAAIPQTIRDVITRVVQLSEG